MPIFPCSLFECLYLFMVDFFNNFTMNTKYGAMAVTATPIVIFGSIYVAWAYASRAWRGKPSPKVRDHMPSRSLSIGAIHGGKLALERLVDFEKYRADSSALLGAVNQLKNSLEKELPDFDFLKSTVAKVEMSGEETEAVTKLKNALEEARRQKKPHEAYEIEMLLVEMLIYKGEFEEALKYKCLDEEGITDARRPLYKAIIHVRLDNSEDDKASKFFDDFREIQDYFQWPPASEDSEIYKVISDFEEFKKVVKLLKQDIKEATARK